MVIHLDSVSDNVILEREVTCSKSAAPCVSGFGGQKRCGKCQHHQDHSHVNEVDFSGSGLQVGLFLSWASFSLFPSFLDVNKLRLQLIDLKWYSKSTGSCRSHYDFFGQSCLFPLNLVKTVVAEGRSLTLRGVGKIGCDNFSVFSNDFNKF